MNNKLNTISGAENGDDVRLLKISASDHGVRGGDILGVVLVVVDLDTKNRRNKTWGELYQK
jgi:hypothetical protein